jgi:hypothetical protein
LVEFELEKVVAAWAEGEFVVPVWLDVIYQRLHDSSMFYRPKNIG